MAWTDIDLYAATQTISAPETTILKDNINYLHDGNATTYHHPGTGADYTVTGSLGQDIDSTNFSLSLTTNGGLVMACFYGQFIAGANSSVRVSIIRVENTSYRGRNLFYDFDVEARITNATGDFRGWIKPFPGLPAGTHTFRAIWGVGTPADTGTLLVGYRPRMSVWEMK